MESWSNEAAMMIQIDNQQSTISNQQSK